MSLPSPRLPHRHPARWLWVLLLVWVMEGMTPTASGSPRPDGGQFDSKRGTTLKSGTGLTQASFTWQNNALGSVTGQDETWAAAGIGQPARTRSTVNTYDLAGRLDTETITEVVNVNARLPVATTYSYDAVHNRMQKRVDGVSEAEDGTYTYNVVKQLTQSFKTHAAAAVETTTYGYDSNGNRTSQGIQDAVSGVQLTSYAWDAQNRLKQVTMPDGVVHGYRYDHRTRRIGITKIGGGQAEQGTTVVFSGGLSLAEWEVASASLPTQIASPGVPTVEYSRGPDMGGGVGGLLYSLRGTTLKYNLSNGRGDIVAQTDGGGSLTWTASYEAYGKRTKESGANADKQRANSKDEDPTGLLNEGFRYRDLETGVWLSRDPAGFVDGPNLYAYVKQNPWTSFDPDGLMTWQEAKGYAGDWFSGVGQMWAGYGDVTVGAAVSVGHAVVSLPSNVNSIAHSLADISTHDLGTLGRAGVGAGKEIGGNIGGAVSDFGGRLAQGDERTWGQAVGTALTLGGAKGAQFAKAAPVAEATEVSASAASTAANNSMAIVQYDPKFAVRQILGDHGPTGHLTPGGRSLTPHAAERMVTPPAGRVPMSKLDIDAVLDHGDLIKKVTPHAEGTTVSVQHTKMPGKPQVVVDTATGDRVITVINPKAKK